MARVRYLIIQMLNIKQIYCSHFFISLFSYRGAMSDVLSSQKGNSEEKRSKRSGFN
jgi:hypothetical protein